MPDALLAVVITVMLLAGLAAWVPLLQVVERLLKGNARDVSPELPQRSKTVPEACLKPKVAV